LHPGWDFNRGPISALEIVALCHPPSPKNELCFIGVAYDSHPHFLYARYFLYVTKKLSAGFFAGLRKKTLGQFFPSFACFAHKKLSAESLPSAESWLV
jgi:hypothetical protein